MSEEYYEDLTPYCRLMAPYTLSGVFNIGWLDVKSKFTTGSVSAKFVERLREIIVGGGDFKALVEPIRELPRCERCGELQLLDSRGWLTPNAELWIPAEGKIYASRVTILHFVEVHGYRPPQEYIDTILSLDTGVEFNGDNVYRQKLKESDWFRKGRTRT